MKKRLRKKLHRWRQKDLSRQLHTSIPRLMRGTVSLSVPKVHKDKR